VDQVVTEHWLPVVGYEGEFEVSDHGRIRSLDRVIDGGLGRRRRQKGVMLSPVAGGHSGHLTVRLTGQRIRYVHQLVLEAFVGPCPEGLNGLHWDDDRSNNHISNLYWGTQSENMFDSVRNNRHPMARKTHCKRKHELTPENIIMRKNSAAQVARGWAPFRRECRECKRLYDSQHTTRSSRRRKENSSK
jgi:HNH endonuclease/NUMOD4 motif